MANNEITNNKGRNEEKKRAKNFTKFRLVDDDSHLEFKTERKKKARNLKRCDRKYVMR